MTDRMVDINIDGRTKQINPDNIAYIMSEKTEVRFRGYMMVSICFVLSLLPSLLILPNPVTIGVSALAGLLVCYLILRKMRGDDLSSFGTVNDSYELSDQGMNKLRSAFENMNGEKLNISGQQSTIFSSMEYGYHVNPENVVSVDRIDRSIPKHMLVGFVIVSAAVISYTSLTYTGIERISGVTVGTMLLLVTMVFTISNRPDFVEMEFTNNEERRLLLSRDKSKDVIKYLKGERDLDEIAGRLTEPDTTDEEYPRLEEDEEPKSLDP